MRAIGAKIALLLVCVALGACGEERPRALRNTGYSDRCADFMRLSFPEGDIEIKQSEARISTTAGGDLGLMIVDVDGIRPKIPETGGFLARAVSARCRFENGVLTDFRWTKGPFR